MRRPTWGTTAAALAIGAFGFAAPTAMTMVSATSAPTVLAQGTTTEPPTTTAPDPTHPTDPDGANPPRARRGPGRPIGEIDPAEKAAYEACLQEHGLTLPKPPPEPTSGEAPTPRPRPQLPKIDPDTVKAANEACKDLRPVPKVSDELLAKIRAFEACLKDNGVELTPFDPAAQVGPTATPEDPPAAAPTFDPETMRKAQDACRDLNPVPGGPRPGGGPLGAPDGAGPPPGAPPAGGCMIPGRPGDPGPTGTAPDASTPGTVAPPTTSGS